MGTALDPMGTLDFSSTNVHSFLHKILHPSLMSIQEVVLENANLNNGITLKFGILITIQKMVIISFPPPL